MPKNLKRITGRNNLHFITFCCYQRRRLLDSVRSRNLVIRILGEIRAKYGFALVWLRHHAGTCPSPDQRIGGSLAG